MKKKIYVENTESRGKFIAENIHIKINQGKCGSEFLQLPTGEGMRGHHRSVGKLIELEQAILG